LCQVWKDGICLDWVILYRLKHYLRSFVQLQHAETLETVQQQRQEIARLQADLVTVQDRAILQQAGHSDDFAYQESKVVRDVQRRAEAHAAEAAAAWQASEASKNLLEAAEAHAAAAAAAHARERATLSTEISELRAKCQLRQKHVADAEQKTAEAERTVTFAEEQLAWAKGAAERASSEAQARVAELEAQLDAATSAAAEVGQAAKGHERRATELAQQLANVQEQVSASLL
jgi:chromosome segregation ATPase